MRAPGLARWMHCCNDSVVPAAVDHDVVGARGVVTDEAGIQLLASGALRVSCRATRSTRARTASPAAATGAQTDGPAADDRDLLGRPHVASPYSVNGNGERFDETGIAP